MLPGTLRRHKKRVTNKITLTKTILKRKIGAGVEFDSLPSNFEENKTNLKILFQLYEELAKSSVQLKSHEMNEVIAGKSLSSAISNFSDPLLSSHSSSNLGNYFYPDIVKFIRKYEFFKIHQILHGIFYFRIFLKFFGHEK